MTDSEAQARKREKQSNFFWAVLATVAKMKFYVQLPGRPIAEEPAFLVFGNKIYLNGIGEVFSFRFKTEAMEKLKEVVEKANYPLKLWKSKAPRRNERPFAENLIERFPNQKMDTYLKAFSEDLR